MQSFVIKEQVQLRVDLVSVTYDCIFSVPQSGAKDQKVGHCLIFFSPFLSVVESFVVEKQVLFMVDIIHLIKVQC